MTPELFGMMGAGLCMGIAAVGSAIGIGIAGSAVAGAWKRCYKANKRVPMVLLAFAGNPITQTFYGYILMGQILNAALSSDFDPRKSGFYLGLGIASGLAMTFSAVAQGWIGAAAADAIGDTGKGFANYISLVGICETIALFAMVLSMTML
ncbi:MAG: ATP synthase subunit K [Termitinemataceae bacterium]|nr:MAG: ATP synthase subunit K [Termitinemataceae bacterium]